MIDPIDLRDEVIIPTLSVMALGYPGCDSRAAVNLLVGTAYHESTVGGTTYLRQQGAIGEAGGFGLYQIERATERSIWLDHLRYRNDERDLISTLIHNRLVAGGSLLDLVGNLPYQTAIARLKYWISEFTWPRDPDDIAGLAAIWKEHYNTPLGAGTVDAFIEAFPEEILE